MSDEFQDYENFDYDSTGLGVGGGGGGVVYVKIKKSTGKMLIGRKGEEQEVPGNSITGRLDSVDLDWDKGNDVENIKPHWRLSLFIKAKDVKASEEAGSLVLKTYCLRFPSISLDFTSRVINTLLAVHRGWDRFFQISVWRQTDTARGKDETYMKLRTAKGGDRPATKYKWVEGPDGKMTMPDVPRGKHFATMPDGKKIIDYAEVENFWLQEARLLYREFNGKDCAVDIPLSLPMKVAGDEPAPSAAPPPNPIAAFWNVLERRLSGMPSAKEQAEPYLAELLTKAMPSAKEKGITLTAVSAKVLEAVLKATGGVADISEVNGNFVVKITVLPPIDDLPF